MVNKTHTQQLLLNAVTYPTGLAAERVLNTVLR